MSLEPGSRLGHLRIEARLGEGGMGEVYRAFDERLERPLAVKAIRDERRWTAEARSRFLREARILSKLDHPHICRIYDVVESHGSDYLLLEYVEGVTLRQAMGGELALETRLRLAEQTADALAAAHRLEIVHRDLKPENILIDRYRRWRITDFGIANAAEEEQVSSAGTPAFAAPEQLLGEPQGLAADLFAVAGIVVFALTGEPPFGDGDPQEIVARQLSQRIDLSSYSTALAEWLQTAFSPSPEERFSDAVAMNDAWRKAVQSSLRWEKMAWWRKPAAR